MTITYEFLNDAFDVMKTKIETKPDDDFNKEFKMLVPYVLEFDGKVECRKIENGEIKEITFLITMMSMKELSYYFRITLKK